MAMMTNTTMEAAPNSTRDAAPNKARSTLMRFIIADSFFYFAWMIPVPVYMLFLMATLRDKEMAIPVYCIGLAVSLFVHVTFGHWADKVRSGHKAYVIAISVIGLYGLIFGCAAMVVPNFRWILYAAGEALATLGLLFYWGAFPKWFRATLEAEQITPQPAEWFERQFRCVLGWRLLASLIGNVVGVTLWMWTTRPELVRLHDVLADSSISMFAAPSFFLWNPFSCSALAAAAAIAVGRLTLKPLASVEINVPIATQAVPPQIGSTSSSDTPPADPYPGAHDWPTGRMAWNFLLENGAIAGVMACAAALRVALTTLVVFMPIYLDWVFPAHVKDSKSTSEAIAYMSAFWIAVRGGQALGNRGKTFKETCQRVVCWILRLRGRAAYESLQPKAPEAVSFFIRALLLCVCLSLLGFACIGLSAYYSAWFERYFGLWISCGIAFCAMLFVVYGSIEPTVTDWMTALSPPPIRGALGAYCAALASFFEVLSLILLNWLSIGFSHAGQRSFPVLFTSASLIVLALFLFALPRVFRLRTGRSALATPPAYEPDETCSN